MTMQDVANNPRQAIVVGAGIGGLTLAYRLSQAGFQVSVYERSNNLGGLASPLNVGDVRVDRFYHTILSSDMSMQSLMRETGVDDKLHYTATKQGFYDDGRLFPFNTPFDLMSYPPLTLFQRFRLGMQVLVAQFERDATRIDTQPVASWLNRVSGEAVYRKVWEPLLRAKFDSEIHDIPATYIWSRLRRMLSTRKGVTSKEMMCYLEGGYYTLVEALARQCEELGVRICLGTQVEKILLDEHGVAGIQVAGDKIPASVVVSTLPSPVLADMLPEAVSTQYQLRQQDYLGVLCPLLILKKRLTPYYVLNITDKQIPFTAVVETTNLIDPQYVGGYHLVYLPKYLAASSPYWQWDEERIRAEWLRQLCVMFPDFDHDQIVDLVIQRARFVEPLRPLGTNDQIPPLKALVPGLYMSNSAMVYPDLNNGESITLLAQKIVSVVLQDFNALQMPSSIN